MPTYEVNTPDGQKFRVNAPSGATQDDAIKYVQTQFYGSKQVDMPAPEKGWGQKLQEGIEYLPRTVGLTARAGVQGVGDTLDFLASPFRAALNAAMPKQQSLSGLITGEAPKDAIEGRTGEAIANLLHLPSPVTEAERIGGKGAELMAGAVVPMGAAAKVKPLVSSPTGKAVATQFAANPASQLASAAGAGTAGEYAKETGGGTAAQLVAAVAGGITAPAAIGAANSVATAGKRIAQNMAAPQTVQAQIDVTINNALKDSGYKLSDIPFSVANQLKSDVESIVKGGGELNADALRRLVDYRIVGANPLKGNLTLNPGDITRQQNLGKIGMNSQDKSLQRIGDNANQNNSALIRNLNDLGANTADDAIAAGQKVIGALQGKNDTAKGVIDGLYDRARNTAGRSAELDHVAFVNQANNLLDDALLGGKLPTDVRTLLNKSAQGEMPLTVDVAEQFKTSIGALQRASADQAERKALGKVREALDATPLLDGQGQGAIDAFNRARKVNAAWMKVVDRTPALQAVRDGIEPDKFVNTFIIGNGQKSNMMDVSQLRSLVGKNEEAQQAIRGQIAAHLKSKALGGASDEVGNFSQSNFNKALDAIGDRKLSLFFSKPELSQLRAVGRVASYEQVQPRGSAVNNSNTAGATIGSLLDALGNSPLLRKIPFGAEILGNPAKSISANLQAGQVLNPTNALMLRRAKQPMAISPSALIASEGLFSP